jgi:Flp pilus assembly protein TadG
MTSVRRSRRARRGQRAQAMIEFALVVPVLLALAFGALDMYAWQLNIDSAQFAAEEGLQTAAIPPQATTTTGLLCSAGERAYQALSQKSFIGHTTLLDQALPSTCSAASPANPIPDFNASCPGPSAPTYSSMLAHLNTTATAAQHDVALICTTCIDVSVGAPCAITDADTDEAQLTVTVVGYKPILVGLPFVGDRIPYYGQNSQTVQEFQ